MRLAVSTSENCRRISPETVLLFRLEGLRFDLRVYHFGYSGDQSQARLPRGKRTCWRISPSANMSSRGISNSPR